IDAPAQAWYEERHRRLAAAGAHPGGPASIDEWRVRHHELHPHRRLLDALRARYDERVLERLPYFGRWLGDPESEPLEEEQLRRGTFSAIGWRWAGLRRA